MEMNIIENNHEIVANEVYNDIKNLIQNSRRNVYQAVNTEMLDLYWNIGKRIMEIQEGSKRAEYGKSVIKKVSDKLMRDYGKGFSVPNLRKMRQFFLLLSNSLNTVARIKLVSLFRTYKNK